MLYINIEKRSRHRESAQDRQDSLSLEMEDNKDNGNPSSDKEGSPETVLKVQYSGQDDSKEKATEVN